MSMIPVEQVDLLVIGSGAAGLSVALGAAGRRVCVITPERIGFDGSSALAQGGIAAAVGMGDDPARHADDTMLAGAGHGNLGQVARLTQAAPAIVEWLQRLDCPLDRATDGRLLLGLEAAHSRPRIVHAGGDRSGALLMDTLLRATRRSPDIDAREGWRALAPLMSYQGLVGARVQTADGSQRDIRAAATVLASGGLTALFSRFTGSVHADGAGHCFAMAAGAALCDLEFVQFHPTALDLGVAGSGAAPLLTEALRGAGARLRHADGRPLFSDADRNGGDLGPRDRVARAVYRASQSGGAFLDLRGDLAAGLSQRFPAAALLCRRIGIDASREMLPVSPAAHYHMGGVAVDANGATGVPGLYAVGEVAFSGVHGANRLASNSLLEALAFGRELGQRLAQASIPRPASGGWHAVAPASERFSGPLRTALADCLWRSAGPVRDANGMDA
ncbi:MAG: FAD-dependent oxidoreductase, partial [Lysobacteraceae bacterium]